MSLFQTQWEHHATTDFIPENARCKAITLVVRLWEWSRELGTIHHNLPKRENIFPDGSSGPGPSTPYNRFEDAWEASKTFSAIAISGLSRPFSSRGPLQWRYILSCPQNMAMCNIWGSLLSVNAETMRTINSLNEESQTLFSVFSALLVFGGATGEICSFLPGNRLEAQTKRSLESPARPRPNWANEQQKADKRTSNSTNLFRDKHILQFCICTELLEILEGNYLL